MIRSKGLPRASSRGFTLIELLIAASLSAVVIGALTAYVMSGVRFAGSITKASSSDANIRSIISRMSEDISQSSGSLDGSTDKARSLERYL